MYLTGKQIKAMIDLVFIGKTNKDTWDGAGIKFIW
jgi:hypothetical protein